MDMKGKYYAHTPATGSERWHDLVSHLERTAERAHKHASKFGAGELGRLAGLWHDIGKFNPAFQDYLKECYRAETSGEKVPRGGSVPHAVYGAVHALHSVQALAAVIHGHHAGLPNQAKYRDSTEQDSTKHTYDKVFSLAKEVLEGLEFDGDLRSLFTDAPQDELQMEVLQRMLFSSLVDADFLDTEHHFDPDIAGDRGAVVSVGELWEVFERDQASLHSSARSDSPVNSVRREVYEACVESASGRRGVFRLSVPTGGGKTRSGLAFALRHAVEHDLDRVIVAVPFTSIIEQTADVYREIFAPLGEGALLEHHSAVRRVADDELDLQEEPREAERLEADRTRARLATQNWDAPLVVTTTVQLFESLFANRTSRCRKLHNVANSVIVLDEVQTLPVSLLAPTVDLLRELVRRYGVTVVLCTATQPALDESGRYLEGFEDVRDVVAEDRAREHFRSLRRVEYRVPRARWTWEEVAENLLSASPERRAMVVVNTKKDALALLDRLGDGSVLHLSTLLCGAHRRDVLEEVGRRLGADEPCLLVATQVVEAGVDLDFPVVFRAMGPLDRIAQTAGRCNREGKLALLGKVVVFEPEEGRMPPGEYRTGADEARNMLENGRDLHDPEVFREYFRNLYQGVDTDARGIQKLRKEFDFPEVARRYRLISDASVPVIVRYGEAWAEGGEMDELVGKIRKRGIFGRDHRRLQPYAVSMFEREFEKRRDETEPIAEGVFLWNGKYDALRGIESAGVDPEGLIW